MRDCEKDLRRAIWDLRLSAEVSLPPVSSPQNEAVSEAIEPISTFTQDFVLASMPTRFV